MSNGYVPNVDQLGLDPAVESSGGASGGPENPGGIGIIRCIETLKHVCLCRNANCQYRGCPKMKRVVAHSKYCQRKANGGCIVCKQFIALICYHAKFCRLDSFCVVPLCRNVKDKLEQQRRNNANHV